ncbi:hypothetical protein KW787_00150 [Candidatus Pacearchaeota archaeon]|nr:hypothetical protein [Candidatus Pacearchaeota archaeon]
MHQTRQETSTRLPIPRKGTKYVARAIESVQNSVPVVIAVRDMLKLARTAKEVREMIKEKLLKINGRTVYDYRESIKLFHIFEAGKSYQLTLLTTGKFAFEETKSHERLCKVVGKKLVSKGKVQLHLHDGSTLISPGNVKVGDSFYIDFAGKIKKHVSLEKGKSAFVFSGRYKGMKGKIEGVKDHVVSIKFDDSVAELEQNRMAVL